MATRVLVRVFFHGLMMFVPDRDASPSQLEVLLADARHPPHASDGCPIPMHHPYIIFEPRDAESCEDLPMCQRERTLCRCELEEYEVAFPLPIKKSPAGPLARQVWHAKPADPPATVVMDSLSSCIPRLPMGRFSIDHKLRPDLFGPNVCEDECKETTASLSTAKLEHSLVVATTAIPLAGDIVACNTPGKSEPWKFKPLTRGAMFPIEKPPVELVVAPLESSTALDPAYMRLHLRRAHGGGSHELEVRTFSCPKTASAPRGTVNVRNDLEPISDKVCVDIAIVNEPHHEPGHVVKGRCGSDHLGRDFELLHYFLDDPRHLERRPVPHQLYAEAGYLEARQARLQTEVWPRECYSKVLEAFLDHLRNPDALQICGGGTGPKPGGSS